jgi:hypothetical protein
VILTILRFTGKVTFDAAGARNTPQLGVKALFRDPIEPMLHVHFVGSVQVCPLGRKHAAR